MLPSIPSRRILISLLAAFAVLLGLASTAIRAQADPPQARNFRVAVYIPVATVLELENPETLARSWATISSQIKVNKVYLETSRGRVQADGGGVERVKSFFAARGVATAGAIDFAARAFFPRSSFCYTNSADRAYVKQAARAAARHFNEVLIADFFDSTKQPSDIAAKGARTWTQFRAALMDSAARDLVVGPMKNVNPGVKALLVVPDPADTLAGVGYDLPRESMIFAGFYGGPGAEDSQPIQSFQSVVYLRDAARGRFGGSLISTSPLASYDAFAEATRLALFAKSPEITFSSYDDLLTPLDPALRGDSQGAGPGTAFDYGSIETNQRLAQIVAPAGSSPAEPTLAAAAAQSVQDADKSLGALGRPVGVAAYAPSGSAGGEAGFYSCLGMTGVPVAPHAAYPAASAAVLLDESAASDGNLIAEIKGTLIRGGTIVMTSGLLAALQSRGLRSITEINLTGNREQLGPGASAMPILLPQLRYSSGDAAPLAGASAARAAVVLQTRYASGALDIVAVPDDPADLVQLPRPVLDALRLELTSALPAPIQISLSGPAPVALLPYAGGSFVVESFLPDTETVQLFARGGRGLKDLDTGETIAGDSRFTPVQADAPAEMGFTFAVQLKPHSYRVFSLLN